MGRIVLFVSIAFLFGLGSGLLLGLRGRSGEEPRGPAPEAPEAGAPADRPVPAPLPPVGDREPPGSAAPVKASHRSLEDLVSAVPLPAVEEGSGTIQGRVLTEGGEPLAGVLVRARKIRRPEEREEEVGRSLESPEEPSLEARVRDLISEERWSRAHTREARSSEDGAFTLTGLAQAGYWIEAYRKGYQIQPADRRRGSYSGPGETVELVATAVLEVPVTVLLPDGTEAPKASVRVEGPAGESGGRFRSEQSWSPRKPGIGLSPGTHRLRAVQGEDGELSSPPEEVTLVAGTPPAPVTLRLRGHPGINGRVLFPKGDELGFAEVHVLRVHPPRSPDLKRLGEDGESQSVRSGQGGGRGAGGRAPGTYLFKNLAPGTYLLAVSRGHRRVLATETVETVEVSDQVVTRDLTLPPLQPSDYFVLRVYGPQGEVLTKVDISTGVSLKNGGGSSGSGGEVRRSDGSFLVLHHDWGEREGEEATNSVTVRTEKYPPRTVEYQRSKTSEITVQFNEPAVLEVTLDGYVPGAQEGRIQVGIEEEKTEPTGGEGPRLRRFSSHRLSEDEREGLEDEPAILGPLEPGAYRVILSYQRGRHGGYPILTRPVVLRPGKNALTLRVPRLFPLTVFLDGAPGDSSLSLEAAGEGGRARWQDFVAGDGDEEPERWQIHEQVGKDGQVFLDGLPEGSYKVTFHGGEEPGEMLVSVPAQSEVRFQARKLNAMRVKVEDPEGSLARAGLQTGDLIVGINGEGFDSQRGWWSLLARVSREKEVKLLVQRGNSLLEIPMSPRRIREAAMEPASR